MTITEAIELEVPQGKFCHGYIKSKNKSAWCKYHEIKKATLSKNGTIQSNFCNLSEEFVNRKMCGFNETY